MEATYSKEYIKEKCIKKIASLEVKYCNIDLKEAGRLEKEATELVDRYSKNNDAAYQKHQEGYNKAYSKAQAVDREERRAHYDASEN